MKIVRLDDQWEAALEGFLEQDRPLNLFLLGFLEIHAVNRAIWYGAVDHEELRAIALLVPGRLAVPYSTDSEAAAALGRHLRGRRHRPTMTVGPRGAVDAVWHEWASATPTRCFYNQRLYVCDRAPEGPPLPGFRRALESEWKQIAKASGQMEEEDLGRNPFVEDRAIHEAVVLDRIRSGRTWVIERDGDLLFQINLGTTTRFGCQVGGTYVPPEHRGKGLATAGMRELARRLVDLHGCVTLHVNEANIPAVRVYEASGFRRANAMRLIAVESPA